MGLVYSTDRGRLCPECQRPLNECQCKTKASTNKKIAADDTGGIVRLQRQTQGRGGKVVTTITGLSHLPAEELKQLAKRLKQLCGSGGTVSDGKIEIQGDHRPGIKSELERLGYTVKLAGG
jgi:translation initiation factor 1